MGSDPSTGPLPRRVPLDESRLTSIERGILTRARKAGFSVELVESFGASGSSTRLTCYRKVAERSGLVHFSITRLYPTPGTAETWVRFGHWPERKATVAEVRAELEAIIKGETP